MLQFQSQQYLDGTVLCADKDKALGYFHITSLGRCHYIESYTPYAFDTFLGVMTCDDSNVSELQVSACHSRFSLPQLKLRMIISRHVQMQYSVSTAGVCITLVLFIFNIDMIMPSFITFTPTA